MGAFLTLAAALLVWGAIGLAVARWSWRWLGIYPTTTRGHLALGATSHVWPLLLAVVGVVWWHLWWLERHVRDDRP